MPLPALSQFVACPPAFTLTTPISEVQQALGHASGALSSHIIIVDVYQRPIGALPVNPLWQEERPFSRKGALNQLEAWIDPIVQVSAQQTLQEVWPLPSAETAPPVVVVDEAMRYVGIINPLAVLTWLSGEVQINETSLDLRTITANTQADRYHQSWLLEVSHALKNPLTSLLGLSTLLLDQRVGQLNDRQTRYVTLMQQVVRKLIGLVNQLLDWMRLDGNQLHFEIEPIPLQSFIQRTLSSYRTQLPTKHDSSLWFDQLSLDLPSTPVEVRADSLRLQQAMHWVLDYLLSHQAKPAGLEVTPWGTWLGLTLWTLEPPIDALETLPDWDQPLPVGRLTTSPGTLDGLGILLARRFCQMQGGDLTYRVSKGGNRITLLLPPAPLPESTKADLPTTVLVLLVCCRGDIIDQVHLHLQQSRYRIALARTIQKAEGMIQRLMPPFIVVCTRSFPTAEPLLDLTVAEGGRPPLMLQLMGNPEAGKPGKTRTGLSVTLQTLKPILEHHQEDSTPIEDSQCLPDYTLLLLPLAASKSESQSQPGLTIELRSWLQHYQCRLLQVDDLAQAQVLSRVWQPDAILLDTQQPIPGTFWQALAQFEELIRLPLITLHDRINRLIAEDLALQVHPCLLSRQQSPQQEAIDIIQTITAALKQQSFSDASDPTPSDP
jgi:hypothetical protein